VYAFSALMERLDFLHEHDNIVCIIQIITSASVIHGTKSNKIIAPIPQDYGIEMLILGLGYLRLM